jgi:predicted RNA-binding Zn-ribbon protein involved in translation (DUF1610 family)
MAWYDVLHAGWRLRCPEADDLSLVGLVSFRRVSVFPGPTRPPAYQVDYCCPQCGDTHQALMTGPQLDLHPVLDPLPPHHDFQTGASDWDAGGLQALWAQSMRRKSWPLNLYCREHQRQVGGWPSLLRHLEPNAEQDVRSLLVHFDCPVCERREMVQMSPAQLSLTPAGWT